MKNTQNENTQFMTRLMASINEAVPTVTIPTAIVEPSINLASSNLDPEELTYGELGALADDERQAYFEFHFHAFGDYHPLDSVQLPTGTEAWDDPMDEPSVLTDGEIDARFGQDPTVLADCESSCRYELIDGDE